MDFPPRVVRRLKLSKIYSVRRPGTVNFLNGDLQNIRARRG